MSGYLGENFLNVYKKRQTKYYAYQTLAAGTTGLESFMVTVLVA